MTTLSSKNSSCKIGDGPFFREFGDGPKILEKKDRPQINMNKIYKKCERYN